MLRARKGEYGIHIANASAKVCLLAIDSTSTDKRLMRQTDEMVRAHSRLADLTLWHSLNTHAPRECYHAVPWNGGGGTMSGPYSCYTCTSVRCEKYIYCTCISTFHMLLARLKTENARIWTLLSVAVAAARCEPEYLNIQPHPNSTMPDEMRQGMCLMQLQRQQRWRLQTIEDDDNDINTLCSVCIFHAQSFSSCCALYKTHEHTNTRRHTWYCCHNRSVGMLCAGWPSRKRLRFLQYEYNFNILSVLFLHFSIYS